MDPQQAPHNLPFADDDAKLEAEMADPAPISPPPRSFANDVAPPPPPPPRVMPPAAPSMSSTPPIQAMPVVNPAPSAEVKKSADPEDIFSDLEQKRPLSSMNTVLPPAAASSDSPLKYILLAIGILFVCGFIVAGIWYFAIHRPAQQVVQQPLAPAQATPSQDTIPSDEPAPSAPAAEPPSAPAPATPVEPSVQTPEFVAPSPVTTTPNGTNVPPPTTIAVPPAPATTSNEDLARLDTDKDGITDVRENELGTDPNKADSDGDGLTDGDENAKYRTNPLNPDSDGDGYPDGVEVKQGYNPLGNGKCVKSDCSV